MTACSSQLINSLHSFLCSTPPSTPVKKAWLDNDREDASLTMTCCHGPSNMSTTITDDGSVQTRSLVCGDDNSNPMRDDDVSYSDLYIVFLSLICHNGWGIQWNLSLLQSLMGLHEDISRVPPVGSLRYSVSWFHAVRCP